MKRKFVQQAVLISVLVLPALIYIVFINGQQGIFFETLDYVGPTTLVDGPKGEEEQHYSLGEWSFTDIDSNAFGSQELDSTIYVLSFFFATCPTVCPAMNFHLNDIERRWVGSPDIKLVSITVDPEKDTPARLKKYAADNGYNTDKWIFLTGDEEEIYAFAKRAFLNAFEDHTAPGGFLHSQSAILVDWNGRIRSRRDDLGNLVGSYDVLDATQLKAMESDIKVLNAEFHREKHNKKK